MARVGCLRTNNPSGLYLSSYRLSCLAYEPADLADARLRVAVAGGAVGVLVLQEIPDAPALYEQRWTRLRISCGAAKRFVLPSARLVSGDLEVCVKLQSEIAGGTGQWVYYNGTHHHHYNPPYPDWVWQSPLYPGILARVWRGGMGYTGNWVVASGGGIVMFVGPVTTLKPDGAYTPTALLAGATCTVAGAEASWWDQPT